MRTRTGSRAACGVRAQAHAARRAAGREPGLPADRHQRALEADRRRRPDAVDPRPARRHHRPALLPALDHRAAGAVVGGAHALGRAGVPLLLAVEPGLAGLAAGLSGADRAAQRAAAAGLGLVGGLRRLRAAVRAAPRCTWRGTGPRAAQRRAAAARPLRRAAAAKPRGSDYLLWLALPALGSWLLLAITNHITQNVAAIPFLWVLPLSVYLLTFVLMLRERPLVPPPRVPAAGRGDARCCAPSGCSTASAPTSRPRCRSTSSACSRCACSCMARWPGMRPAARLAHALLPDALARRRASAA